MRKYIDADKVKNGIMKFVNEYGEIVGMFVNDFNILLERSAVDVVERKRGTWIEVGYWSEGVGMGESYGNYFRCSACEKRVQSGYKHCDMNFCPNCGADMRER